MAKRNSHLAVAIVVGAAVSGGAWWFQNRDTSAGAMDAVAAQSAASGPSMRQEGVSGGAPPASSSGKGPGGQGAQGGPPAVEVARVELSRIEDDSQAVGSLRALQGVVLRPEVSGRIQSLSFGDGQRVRKGQLLVQLDDTLQQAQLKQAEASAAIARTNLQRSRELASQNFVSQSAVDQNAAALEVALAQVALAQAQLGRMKVFSPFDGIAGIRTANVGDYVKDGADIVLIEDLSSIWVDFRLPERNIARLRPGQAVEVTLDAMPGRGLTARIEAIDAQLDANGRSLLVRARVSNADGRLRGGMFARVRTVFDVREKALMVPEEALVPQGNRQLLFRVVDGPSGGKVAQRTEVRIGSRVPGKVEILQGVREDDTVVIAGQARLMRGDAVAVRVVDLNRAGGGRPAASGGAGAAPGEAGPPGSTSPRGKGSDAPAAKS